MVDIYIVGDGDVRCIKGGRSLGGYRCLSIRTPLASIIMSARSVDFDFGRFGSCI